MTPAPERPRHHNHYAGVRELGCPGCDAESEAMCPYCGRPEGGVHGDHRVRPPLPPPESGHTHWVTNRDTCPLCLAGTPGRHADIGGTHAGLDAAWAEAQAALPKGWVMGVERTSRLAVAAASPYGTILRRVQTTGATPADALHTLAAALARREKETA